MLLVAWGLIRRAGSSLRGASWLKPACHLVLVTGGPLKVVYYASLEEIEAAVVDGQILAGLSTSRPDNADNRLVEFPASLVTMRAPMYRPPDGVAALDSQQLREAMDAATVRAIADGGYQALEAKYFASNAFDSVAACTRTPYPNPNPNPNPNPYPDPYPDPDPDPDPNPNPNQVAAFSCGIEPSKFPFPPKAEVTSGELAAVLARKTLRVGAPPPLQLASNPPPAGSNPPPAGVSC
jgi:hypothetical protein